MTPLHDRYGVEVENVDLRAVTAEDGYAAIRAAFEEHSLLLFRNQCLDDAAHLRLGALFGPIEVRAKGPDKPPPSMSMLTNLKDGVAVAEDAMQVMRLKANMLWHTDSTFLPAPALLNILAARTMPSSGGETELVSTRAAWSHMPEPLKAKVRDAAFRHSYGHSRAKVSAALAAEPIITMWEDQTWRALWRNPVNGRDALYIASHTSGVVGIGEAEGLALIDELTAFATQRTYVYSHPWRPGDVLIWDERATMHRGRPWPYDEPRVLASICVTATERDGLESMRPGA